MSHFIYGNYTSYIFSTAFTEETAKRVPDKVALVCGDERLTYADINNSADRLAAALIDMGVQRQDRVAIFMDNSAESVISLFGILKAGGIFIMLNATMKARKLNYILKHSGARVLIGQQSKSKVISQSINDTSELKHIIWKLRTGNKDGLGPLDQKDSVIKAQAWDELA